MSLCALIQNQVRAFTWAELVALSSESKVRRAVASGELTRVVPGVYVAKTHAHSFHARAHAAILWAGSAAAINGVGALFLWGLVDKPPEHIEIAVPHGWHKRTPPWLKARRFASPIGRRPIGRLVVVDAAEAVVQGYGVAPPRARSEVVYRGTRSGLVTPAKLRTVLAQTPRVRSRRSLERRVSAAERGAESFLEEHALHTVFNTGEFAQLIRQHDVVVEGCLYRLDLYDEATRTAIELDSEEHHGRMPERQRDVNRDVHLATIGIQTLRFTYADITTRPKWCRAMVRNALAARALRR